MKTKSGLVKRGAAVAMLVGTFGATPAFAVPDAGFLPQCGSGEMFSILSARCIPLEYVQGYGLHESHSNEARGGRPANATPSTPPAPPI